MVLDFHECISNHRSTDIDRKQCHLKLVVAIFWLNLFNILKKKISMVRYNKTFKVSNYNMWVFINYKKRVYSFKNNILKRKIYWLLCWHPPPILINIKFKKREVQIKFLFFRKLDSQWFTVPPKMIKLTTCIFQKINNS